MAIDYWEVLPPWQVDLDIARQANVKSSGPIGPVYVVPTYYLSTPSPNYRHNVQYSSYNQIVGSATRVLRSVELLCFEAIVRRARYGTRPFKDKIIWIDGSVQVTDIVIVGGEYSVTHDGNTAIVSCSIQMAQGEY